MSLLGRLRAALGRDVSSLMLRAERDLRLGLALNPPACLPPLRRAVAALEHLPASPEVALLLGPALRAQAEATSGRPASDLRARAVAKLTAQVNRRDLTEPMRAALWSALAQAWLPLPQDAEDPSLTLRQLLRAQEAQTQALARPDAAGHLAMADIAAALSRHHLCADPRSAAQSGLQHCDLARHFPVTADQDHAAQTLCAAILAQFPDLMA